ncbi:MAG: crosslink repair DNA glycosylase YcaQ family protein [Candidatus Udaeobacter sp.]
MQRFAVLITLDHLRRYAVARSLFKPTTLKGALYRMGFVQADPIRAPARAQDLILRHRAKDYHAGDLERLYPKLKIEEDFFVVYGFMTKSLQALMHPRSDADVPAEGPRTWPAARKKRAQLLLEFVRERGEAHPREVDDHFSHGSVRNYWGGLSSATTHLLAAMHYRGMLRIVRRESGIRIYAVNDHGPAPADAAERCARIDALVDAAVQIYAPLPSRCLADLVRRLRFAVPQWQGELKDALQRAKQRLAHARIDGLEWYWPSQERPLDSAPQHTVRLLTPFDPVVWDRDRFEILWGWQYRFEAYVPAAKRERGYYALPLLYGDRVIGWGNLRVQDGQLKSAFGYVVHRPRGRVFKRELDAELERIKAFLAVPRAEATVRSRQSSATALRAQR